MTNTNAKQQKKAESAASLSELESSLIALAESQIEIEKSEEWLQISQGDWIRASEIRRVKSGIRDIEVNGEMCKPPFAELILSSLGLPPMPEQPASEIPEPPVSKTGLL
jgi:hypothetical protein